MKLIKQGLCLALLGTGLAVLPSATAGAAPDRPSIVERMRADADTRVQFSRTPSTGKVGWARTTGDLLPSVKADTRTEAAAKADRYLDEYAAAFGAAASQLQRTDDVAADRTGWTFTYEQSYRGVPVFGAELHAHVNRAGELTTVNGFAAPDLSLDVSPRVSKAQAEQRALDMVQAQPAGYEPGTAPKYTDGLQVRSSELMVYRMGITRGIEGPARLAWVVEVWNQATIRETVILDAHTNKELNRWSMMAHALDRELYEASLNDNGTPDEPSDDTVEGLDEPVWTEGDPFPGTLDEDQQNEVLGAGETYWMFRNTFGYNSWDGTGGKMITVNNDPRIDCPNANWNGVTTNYCSGVTGDDTVAHEWGHAYTESTSGLIYQWQAGAMNEAYSDIWGETVDMLNARHNETVVDIGGVPTTVGEEERRSDSGACSIASPGDLSFVINSPAEVAGPCDVVKPAWSKSFGDAGLTTDVVVGIDEANEAGPSTTDGCTEFSNAAAFAGKFVFVDRGTCTFQEKIDNAKASGALGLVLGNNQPGLVSPSGTVEDFYGASVSQADGTRIKSAGTVNVTIRESLDGRDNTARWLSGEDDPAFGGAIRDMWNPTCYGDPGRVSDAEYHCGADDAGGVHSNSGVVNRTFAILVDGLPEAGVTAIGLDKAAWLFWYSQFHLLTPTSYFPDLANSLETACTELTGQDIERVTLGNSQDPDGSDGAATPEVIDGGMTPADCASVTAAIAETELRTDPTEQCGWGPLLRPGAPALECGAGTTTQTVFSEDFEGADPLAGWTQDEDMVFADTETFPFVPVSGSDAHGHDSTAVFSPAPAYGACDKGPNDITGRSSLISPAIVVPGGQTPRLSFDHYVATEAGYDGANVKVSVNGGPFQVIAPEAYLYNGPEGILDPQQGPMGGEPAWTGTDAGQLTGSWGTSIVDLTKVAPAGTSVRFRFDLGRDGCGGVDGWYIDNVTVASCVNAPPPAPVASTVTATPTASKVRGKKFTVVVSARTANGPVGGPVSILRKGKIVEQATLPSTGTGIIKVKGRFPKGKQTFTVRYLGTTGVALSETTFTLKVVKKGDKGRKGKKNRR